MGLFTQGLLQIIEALLLSAQQTCGICKSAKFRPYIKTRITFWEIDVYVLLLKETQMVVSYVGNWGAHAQRRWRIFCLSILCSKNKMACNKLRIAYISDVLMFKVCMDLRCCQISLVSWNPTPMMWIFQGFARNVMLPTFILRTAIEWDFLPAGFS